MDIDVGRLAGLRVIVVEDETMIAMGIEDILSNAGCEIIGSAGTVEEALELIKREKPDGVTLDGNLEGELSGPVARQLAELGIPHLVVTGYVELAADDLWLSRAPRLEKPFTPHTLTKAAAEHLCSRK